jgi:hypothetical protein
MNDEDQKVYKINDFQKLIAKSKDIYVEGISRKSKIKLFSKDKNDRPSFIE